ncbi:lactosylceramide 4-alpha-galactosyltransferase-like [Neocloeon triangulifer]|uniref:lactosylceramide 4-alpha-galactosyltransferase-like n=1 Tax=Neocloeon triangulifer TaxID=2078957 RepID=UPI00286EBEE4|nr:lactosylceramide 4-alpha-galactosyltransferase-like [Neocloeon triangulifer]
MDYSGLKVKDVIKLKDLTPMLADDSYSSSLIFGRENKVVFFIESSGTGVLSTRQLCTIESLQENNPEVKIVVLYVDPVKVVNLAGQSSLFKVLRNANGRVVLATVNATYIVEKSGIFKTTAQKIFHVTPYKTHHVSDILRLILIWKFGGFYMDTDLVIFKNLDKLLSVENFLLSQVDDSIAPYFFGFRKNHPMLQKMMETARDEYLPHYYATVPNAMGSAISRHFKVTVKEAIHRGKVDDVLVVNSTVFSPISLDEFVDLFRDNNQQMIQKIMGSSLGIHVWNYKSGETRIMINSSSPYSVLARDHCPRAYFGHESDFF